MRRTALLASDTSPEAERAQVELWRRMSPLEKMRAVTEISRAVDCVILRRPTGSVCCVSRF
jgi:hypothetical protein